MVDPVAVFKGYGKVQTIEDQTQHQNTNATTTTQKPLITTVALLAILLLTLTIGLLLGTLIHESESPSLSSNWAASLKAVCNVTRYPESCFSSIFSLSSNLTCLKPTDPEAIFKLSLQVSVAELKSFKTAVSNSNEAALRDCQTQIEDALGRLGDSVAAMEVGRGGNMLTEAKISDLQTWISAAMTDQETCLDGLEEMESTAIVEVKTKMQRSREYTSNSLAILASMHALLDMFNMKLH